MADKSIEDAYRRGFRDCQMCGMAELKQDRIAAEQRAWDAYEEALRATPADAEPEPTQPAEDDDPWFQLGWYKERLRFYKQETATWKERAMQLRLNPPTDTRREILEDHLCAMLEAQKVQPYRGWELGALNRAADAARDYLGLPSIRDLNPDIAAMEDAAVENAAAIRALIPTPAPTEDRVKMLEEGLNLAANRLGRLVIEQSFGSLRAYEVSEWEAEARALLNGGEHG